MYTTVGITASVLVLVVAFFLKMLLRDRAYYRRRFHDARSDGESDMDE